MRVQVRKLFQFEALSWWCLAREPCCRPVLWRLARLLLARAASCKGGSSVWLCDPRLFLLSLDGLSSNAVIHSVPLVACRYDGERAQIHVLPDGSVKARQQWRGAQRQYHTAAPAAEPPGQRHAAPERRTAQPRSLHPEHDESAACPEAHLLLVPPGPQIYSRNSEDNTGKYPDIVSLIPEQLKPGITRCAPASQAAAHAAVERFVAAGAAACASSGQQLKTRSAAGMKLTRSLPVWWPCSVVLDAEAVAYDREEGKVLPFQVRDTLP